jgi:lipoprotein-releasing system permease protein
MQIPYELILGWRYTRAGRSTRRNGFISFISGVSMLGIALGVGALIIVLSVMNGFQKEVRDRMLGVVSHIEIYAQGGAALPDLATARWPRCVPTRIVIGAATFHRRAGPAGARRGHEGHAGARHRPRAGARRDGSGRATSVRTRCLKRLVPGGFGVVLGDATWRAAWACAREIRSR